MFICFPMKRIRSKSYYKLFILFIGLLATPCIKAEFVATSDNRLTHYLGLSISGAEANRIASQDSLVTNKAGWDAAFSATYEMNYRTWFWGFGLGLSLQQVNDVLNPFIDALPRVDVDGENLSYQYVYTAYREQAQTFNLSVPVYFGKYFNRVYALLGLRFDVPLDAQYDVAASMYTQGVYPWSITPVVSTLDNDFSSLGFYPEQKYQYANPYEESMYLSPFIEVGYEFLRAKKVKMRAGAYLAYAIPILNTKRVALADYSAINTNPRTQNVVNMQQNIRWNPLACADKYASAPCKLEAGVKLSVLFNVTAIPGKCMCIP